MAAARRLRRAVFAAVALGVAGAPCVDAADGPANPGFDEGAAAGLREPPGWNLRGDDYQFRIDRETRVDGAASLRISALEGVPSPTASARVTQRFAPPVATGNRLRFSVLVKADAAAQEAGLSVRIESAQGLLFVDRTRGTAPAGTGDWTRYVLDVPVFAAAARVELTLSSRGPGTVWFDRVEVTDIDTATLPAAPAQVVRYVEYALDIMRRNSIRRAAIDWDDFERQVLAQARGARTPGEAHLALRYALGSLGDHHSYLLTPEQTARLGAGPVSNARTGRAARSPRGERVGAAGYLLLPGYAGGSQTDQVRFAEGVQAIIRRLDGAGTCGWIVDLRDNTGGNVWPMLVGIGPLIGNGDVAAARYPDGRHVPLWYRDGRGGLGDFVQLRVSSEAYVLRHASPHVAVLLGRDTASSGEIVAAAFHGLPRSRTFGAPTRGLGSGNRTYDLADGAALVLTVAETSDRNGRVLAGPLLPDVVAPTDDADAPLEAQPAVTAALDWLEARCSKR